MLVFIWIVRTVWLEWDKYNGWNGRKRRMKFASKWFICGMVRVWNWPNESREPKLSRLIVVAFCFCCFRSISSLYRDGNLWCVICLFRLNIGRCSVDTCSLLMEFHDMCVCVLMSIEKRARNINHKLTVLNGSVIRFVCVFQMVRFVFG